MYEVAVELDAHPDDYDLTLRAARATTAGKIRHNPAVLYHWREGLIVRLVFRASFAALCVDAARRAKADYLSARGEAAEVLANPMTPSWERIRRPLPSSALLASLVVHTGERRCRLGPAQAISSVRSSG